MTDCIEIRDLSFSYRRRRVLTNLSWRIGPGITALLGPNGAGKTTLITCMVGLAKPDSGTIVIEGRSLGDSPSVCERIGYVPQSPSLPSLVRVRDIVAYSAWLSGVPLDQSDQMTTRAMAQMEIEDLGRRRIRTLSGGQRQRVALACGIVHDPRILVLDEPTVGLDPGQRLKVREVIRRIGRDRPVVLSTHLTEDVEHLGATVAVLVGGRIAYDGTALDLAGLGRVNEGDTRPGSAFERAYDDLMGSLGASE